MKALLSLVPLLLAPAAPASVRAPAHVGSGPEEMDELLRRYAAEGWSGSVVVARGDSPILARGYGFADFDAGRANDASTLFEIASITKCFTAVAVLRLAQEGKLDLDDSIAVHLPAVPAHSQEITLRQLLSHTSGIPRRNAGGRGEELSLAVIDSLGTGPDRKRVGKMEYWNGGYALLAGVIERASGEPYVDYCRRALFLPARMGDTGFTGDERLDPARAAVGRTGDQEPRTALEHPYGSYGYQYRGMGGIVTTALDLMKWHRALEQGTILDEEHTRTLFDEVDGGYALGWYVGRGVSARERQQHGGSVRGFVADFRRFPGEDACIAVLSNTDAFSPREIADNLECLLFERPPTHSPPRVALVDDVLLQALAGTYVGEAGRMVVRHAPGVLMAGLEGHELLERVGALSALDWNADVQELQKASAEIVLGISRGNTEPLRTRMAKRIPASWPDTMRRAIWPARLLEHGELHGVRPLGATVAGDRVEVVLALDHANGPARARVVFGPAGLELLDWEGPEFPATARLLPLRKGTYRLLLGEDPARIEVETDGPVPTALRVGGTKLRREE